MKNILVAGGAGYIGSHAAKALSRAGYQPIVYDNMIRGNPWAVQWGPCVQADIGDREMLLRTFDSFKIDAVMHFAAFAYVGESMANPEIYFENNAIKSLTLLDAMRTAGIRRLVFSSTCATYGVPKRMPITEQTPQAPVNAYGESKLMVERALRWYDQAHDLRSVALRYFNAAGADFEGEIGENHVPETHLIPLLLDVALGARARIDIYGADYATRDGTCERDYVHVTDLADAHVRALEYLQDGGLSTAINLGCGRGHTVREVIDAVERVTGRSVASREVPRRRGDPPALVADGARAASVLGWIPRYSDLDQIVATAWNWRIRRQSISLAGDLSAPVGAAPKTYPRAEAVAP